MDSRENKETRKDLNTEPIVISRTHREVNIHQGRKSLRLSAEFPTPCVQPVRERHPPKALRKNVHYCDFGDDAIRRVAHSIPLASCSME